MPGIIPVSVTDRAATPVAHVFTPVNVNAGEGSLVERLASGSYIGEPKLFASSRATNKRTKSSLKLVVPKVVEETINGVVVPRVVGTSYVTVTYDWDPAHTAAERNNVQGMAQAAQGTSAQQPFLHPVLTGRESVYSS